MSELNDKRHFVAWLDILGFRSVMTRSTSEAAFRVGDYLRTALEAGLDPKGHTPEIWPEEKIEVSRVRHHAFQDTIVLWADEKTVEGFAGVVQAAYSLVALSLYKQGMPLRGGISEGTLYSSPERGILVGTGPLNAHNLEASQQWAGLVVDSEMVSEEAMVAEWLEECETTGTMTRFRPPLKDRHIQELWCLGWPKECPSNYEQAIEEKLTAQVGKRYPFTQNTLYYWNWWRESYPRGWDFHSSG